MTPEDRRMILSMATVPGRAREGSPDEVLRHFGTTDGQSLGLNLLLDAIDRRDADDVELALIVLSTFGVTMDGLGSLAQLSSADWHHSHEEVVTALGRLRTPAAVDALFQATQWIPGYLDFDESRALATKAIWALGRTPGPEAEQALIRLLNDDDETIRDEASAQLDRRRSSNTNQERSLSAAVGCTQAHPPVTTRAARDSVQVLVHYLVWLLLR